MTETILREAVSAEPVKKGKRWLVTLAVPGRGNSGTYSPEVLETYGPVALPAKTKAYWGHANPEDRDARDALGKYPEGAFWNSEEQKLQAYLEPYPRWNPIIEEMGSDLELSMCVFDGEKDADGNVTRIGYHRANTVDAVAFAGLSGSGLMEQVEHLAESMSISTTEPSVIEAQEKETRMSDEKLDKLIALFESFISESKAKAKDEAQVVADEAAATVAATAAVEAYASNIALVEAARESLLPSQIDGLLESAKSGESIAPLIESAKKVADEARTAVLQESASGTRDFGAPGKYASAADLGKVF
jgi:hypothetical protein